MQVINHWILTTRSNFLYLKLSVINMEFARAIAAMTFQTVGMKTSYIWKRLNFLALGDLMNSLVDSSKRALL